MYEHLEGSDGVYVVDTEMFGVEEYTAAFVIDAEKPVVVDTGLESDAGNVLDAVDDIGIAPEEVEYIVVTHVHLDHAGGVGVVADRRLPERDRRGTRKRRRVPDRRGERGASGRERPRRCRFARRRVRWNRDRRGRTRRRYRATP